MSDHNPSSIPASRADRARALETALSEKNLVPKNYVEKIRRIAEFEWSPKNGARVVARAWVDPSFRERLQTDATAACAELGFEGPQGEYIVALEDTPVLHNVIVCTLCSCTAWPVLGLPPDWYKSFEYRARVVRESRTVLREMGLDLPKEIEIRVWDTTAETRYMVLPCQPKETDAWTEDALAELVTQDVLIGVALPVVQGQGQGQAVND
ncbi:MAG: nitrile hydratase subunit alpha [Cellvibrionales bacterium]|nr:MAG: nitrile hydratase subunit alpha [Cellvibrionales bacterium]